MRSDSQPEVSRSSDAVLSATPSMMPRLATEACSTPVTNSGSTGTIISDDTSVSSDVTPSAHTLRVRPGCGAGSGSMVAMGARA